MISVKRSYSMEEGFAASSATGGRTKLGRGVDYKYMSRNERATCYGDTYVGQNGRNIYNRNQKQTSYSLNKPISLYDTPSGGMRRSFSSCKVIQSKDSKKSFILQYIKDYCVYRIQLSPDKEYIPTPSILISACWNTLDDATDSFSATICTSLFKKDIKEHKQLQRTFKKTDTPARYKIRLQRFLKGPMESTLSNVKLTTLSDAEKIKIFRNMLERVFQEKEVRNENMYDEVDSIYGDSRSMSGGAKSKQQHYIKMTLNDVFSIRKLEKLFILVARHCCFYACIKMDFIIKSIMAEAAEFLVDSLIFDWMTNKLGGMKGWTQVYEIEREIAAGRAQPPSKPKAIEDMIPKLKLHCSKQAPIYSQITEECEERSSEGNSRMGSDDEVENYIEQKQQYQSSRPSRNQWHSKHKKTTGCDCTIM